MSTDLATIPQGGAVQTQVQWNQEQKDLLKRTICAGSTDDEFALFAAQCRRTGLDPFQRQIHAVKRWNSDQNREVMTIQVGIDGFRLMAERTGQYEGQEDPVWCGADGIWRDVWTAEEPPLAARAGVYRRGFRMPLRKVAHYDEYCQTKKDGTPVKMWGKMAASMLAKCAESLALRAAFPNELSGIYAQEEMQQATVAYREGATLPPEAPPKWANRKEMLDAMGTERERVGAETFMNVIFEYGLEKANELKYPADIGKADLILSVLKNKPAEVKQDA